MTTPPPKRRMALLGSPSPPRCVCTAATAAPASGRALRLRGYSERRAQPAHPPPSWREGTVSFQASRGKAKNQTKPTNPNLNDLSPKVKLQKYNEELKGEARTTAAVHKRLSHRRCCLSRGAVPTAEPALLRISSVSQAAVISTRVSQLSFLPFLESFWLNGSIFPKRARKPLQTWHSSDTEMQGCFQAQPQVLKPHQNLTKPGHIWFKRLAPRRAAREGELSVPLDHSAHPRLPTCLCPLQAPSGDVGCTP